VKVLRQALVAALLAAFVVACLRLGWWQLQRYESPAGSLQNLGYTLQWPTFAIFAVIMWWRLRKLERTRREAEPAEPPRPAAAPTGTPATKPSKPPATRIDEPDDELAAYNRYLAQLNQAAQKEHHRGR
jgi:DNA-binding transcriptional regulator of glucitol operon